MQQADGFIEPGREDYVYKLQKSLYGLKQSGRQWFLKLDEHLKRLGLKSNALDNCIYTVKIDNAILAIVVYVDDIIIATNPTALFKRVKKSLETEFDIKDLGLLRYCLGIEYYQNPETKAVEMMRRKYILDRLEKFGMMEAKPAATPLETKQKLSKTDESHGVSETEYRSLIGSLMYAAVGTRPDIAYAISTLSAFCHDPKYTHWHAAKRVLRYLKGTSALGLIFKRSDEPLTGFVDSDWGGDIDDRVSRSAAKSSPIKH